MDMEQNTEQSSNKAQSEQSKLIVSKNKSRRELLLDESAPFVVTEAYKALRTNIMFSLPGTGCKCIAVTSSARSEGKSTNTINLAISLAEIGKRVVLIDADLRLPTVASTLRMRGKPGLSNLLIGEAKINQCDYIIEKYGIHAIPSGTIPPDPTRLLSSKQMDALIDVLRQHYDYIVIDLPPVTTVTDATLLSGLVDGYLLLVRSKSSEHRAVAEMISRLRKVNAKILGFLYVGAEIGQKRTYKKYGYGYGYGYGG